MLQNFGDHRRSPGWSPAATAGGAESSSCPKFLFAGRHSRRAVAQKEAFLPCFNPYKGLAPSRARNVVEEVERKMLQNFGDHRRSPELVTTTGGAESSSYPKFLFAETSSSGRHSRRAIAQKEAFLPCFNPFKWLTPSRAR
ncbi:hypothetical protein ACLB2K_007240 [Fragaria x ananassa]